MTEPNRHPAAAQTGGARAVPSPSASDLARVFGRIGVLSFGGPAAQIALLHRETVDGQNWLDEKTFLRGLGFCMMLPGPEAMQLATYVGWRVRGTWGGLIAGGLFVLPGALVIALLSAVYIVFGTHPQMQAAFVGIQAAVLAIVIAAMARLARKTLLGWFEIALALAAFIALFGFNLAFPLVLAMAATAGALRGGAAHCTRPDRLDHGHLTRTVVILGLLWMAPLALTAVLGADMLFQLGVFFGQLAISTFGGAYAVLAYMTQTVVQDHGWVTTDQMINALGLAETTPGPLILVTQFVGHIAGHGAGGWGMWLAAGAMTLWMTFVPCFLWIFAGAPYLEAIMARPRLAGALAGITAAVVGVMASLAIWFAINALFYSTQTWNIGPLAVDLPNWPAADPLAFACFIVAAGCLWWRGLSVPTALAISIATGLTLAWAGL